MKTLITGVGSCGTTFLARLFMELGCNLGDSEGLNAVDRPRGMEHLGIAQLLTDWDMEASPYPLPAYGVMHRDIGKGATLEKFFHFRDQADVSLEDYLDDGLPEVVKSPLMPHWLHTWLRAGGTRPEVVIVCTRPLRDTVASFVSSVNWLDAHSLYAWQAMRYGLLWDTLDNEHIPAVTIEYPRMIHDVEYLWDMLQDFFLRLNNGTPGVGLHAFQKAHRAIAKPSLVGYYGNS